MIFSENDKCYSIDHCKKCPISDKCELCEIGYILSSDNKNCLSSNINVGSLRKTSGSSANSPSVGQNSTTDKIPENLSMNNSNSNPYSPPLNKSSMMGNQVPVSASAKNLSMPSYQPPLPLGQDNPIPSKKDIPLMNNLAQPKPVIPKPQEHPLASFRPMPSNTTPTYSRFPMVLMIILLIILIGMVIYYCSKRHWNRVGYFYDESGNQEEGTRVVYIR
jgi:hypothetical protein